MAKRDNAFDMQIKLLMIGDSGRLLVCCLIDPSYVYLLIFHCLNIVFFVSRLSPYNIHDLLRCWENFPTITLCQ